MKPTWWSRMLVVVVLLVAVQEGCMSMTYSFKNTFNASNLYLSGVVKLYMHNGNPMATSFPYAGWQLSMNPPYMSAYATNGIGGSISKVPAENPWPTVGGYSQIPQGDEFETVIESDGTNWAVTFNYNGEVFTSGTFAATQEPNNALILVAGLPGLQIAESSIVFRDSETIWDWSDAAQLDDWTRLDSTSSQCQVTGGYLGPVQAAMACVWTQRVSPPPDTFWAEVTDCEGTPIPDWDVHAGDYVLTTDASGRVVFYIASGTYNVWADGYPEGIVSITIPGGSGAGFGLFNRGDCGIDPPTPSWAKLRTERHAWQMRYPQVGG